MHFNATFGGVQNLSCQAGSQGYSTSMEAGMNRRMLALWRRGHGATRVPATNLIYYCVALEVDIPRVALESYGVSRMAT
jgi:hypothetical protein